MKSLHAAIDQVSRSFRALMTPGLGILLLLSGNALLAAPLAVHPTNPHYFVYHGKPEVLITSGEHYGAVLNLDFNYIKYLDTLQSNKLNLTRTWAGAYYEPSGAFNISQNTLAPTADRFICPWAKSKSPGNATATQFDLTQWNPDYFKRLKDFVNQAERRGVIVEMNLFCPFYDEAQWEISPMNSKNNINGLGNIGLTNVHTLDKNGGLLAVQEAMVRQIVTSLKDCDNVYYEICNEPYFGGVTLDWQKHIADVIVDTEKKSKHPHLISQNIANDKAKIEDPNPAVSIFNFHYATPPETVPMNYGLGKIIGDNETGFKGTNDFTYRREGWEFIIAGGALYNNLDYSFTVGHEDGTYAYPASQPGGGSVALRRQLMYLQEFIHSFDFVKMKPDNYIIKGGVPMGATARVLVESGKAYALYIQGGTKATALRLDLPAGTYRVAWFNPTTGTEEMAQNLAHRGGVATLASPAYTEDIALKLVNLKPAKKASSAPPAPRKTGIVKTTKPPERK